MKTAFIIVFFLFLLCVFLFTSVVVNISYEKNELTGKSEIYLKYLFIKKRMAQTPKKEDKEAKKEKKEEGGFEYYKGKLTDIMRIFDDIKADLKKLLKFCSKRLIRIEELNFEFVFGLDDPMYTGLLNGIAYGVVYNILGFICHNMTVEKRSINIVPDFERECHSVKLNCILRLKNVHIIIVIVKLIGIYRKLKKVKKPSPVHNGGAEAAETRKSC